MIKTIDLSHSSYDAGLFSRMIWQELFLYYQGNGGNCNNLDSFLCDLNLFKVYIEKIISNRWADPTLERLAGYDPSLPVVWYWNVSFATGFTDISTDPLSWNDATVKVTYYDKNEKNSRRIEIEFPENCTSESMKEWGEYTEPQDVCPKCDTDHISNEDGTDDNGMLPVTCHNCGYQWIEPDVYPPGNKIELYPDCPKPKWMKVGAWCYCLGEANDKFTVDVVETKTALLSIGGYSHGRESFSKLYRTLSELKDR